MKKRVLSLFLVLAMLLSMVTVTTATVTAAEATTSPVTDVPYDTNITTGTPIGSASELTKLATKGTYYLTADITITATTQQNDWNYNSNCDTFGVYAVASGTVLYGNGHTITDGTTGTTSGDRLSLFNIAGGNGTEFHDLIIKNATVSDSVFAVNDGATVLFDNVDVHCLEMVADDTYDSEKKNNAIGVFDAVANLQGADVATTTINIKNCEITGTVGMSTGKYNTGSKINAYGGFVGYMNTGATVTIENCVNAAAMVNGDADMGGFVGRLAGGSLTVRNSEFKGSALVGGSRVGGFVGRAAGSVESLVFENCVNNLSYYEFINQFISGFVAGLEGGASGLTVSFTNCVNNMDIKILAKNATGLPTEISGQKGSGNGNQLGGFIGRVSGVPEGTAISFTDCTNNGDITTHGSSVGGFVGWSSYTGGYTFQNCVNNGNMHTSGEVILAADKSYEKKSNSYGTGGFFGMFNNSGKTSMTGCINNGTITAASQAGGIIGGDSGWNPQVTLTNCVNNGAIDVSTITTANVSTNTEDATDIVTAETTSQGYKAGGLVGLFTVNPSTGGTLTLDGCANYGSVTGRVYYVGGLVGHGGAGVTIQNSNNYGTITSASDAQYIGGIAGAFDANYAYESKATNCNNYGTVNAGKNVGGILGLTSWTSYSTITSCSNYGTVTGAGVTGGIVGYFKGSSENWYVINKCVNYGTVTSTGSNAGGIVGEAGQNASTMGANKKITNCINVGDVVDKSSSMGGILGYLGATGTIFENCATIGTLSSTGIWRFGGIVGGNSTNYSIKNCHVYSDLSGISYLTGESNNSGIFYGQGSTVTTDGNCTYFAPTVDIRLHSNFTATAVDVATATAKLNAIGVLTFVADANDTDGDGKKFEVATPTLSAVQETSVVGGTFDVRFIAGIDAYHIYNRVGFYVMIDNGDVYSDYAKCKYVYTGIQATVGDTVETYTAADFYSDYIYALTITDVPATGTHTFMIAAVAETGGTDWNTDSTNYQGKVYLVTYTDGQFVSCVEQQ